MTHKENFPDVLVVGDSHILAMGVRKSKAPPFHLSDVPGYRNVLGVAKISGESDQSYWDFIQNNISGKIVLICWRGNQHNSDFLFRRNPLFDFVINGAGSETPVAGAVLVPQLAVRKHFEPSLRELAGIIDALKNGAPQAIAVVGTPAPKGSEEALLPIVQASRHFTDLAKKRHVKQLSVEAITPAPIRQRLWHLLQVMIAETAARAGVRFLPVPPGSLCGDGTLKPAYWGADVTHANTAYGTLALTHFLESLGQEGRAVAQPAPDAP